MGCCVSSPHAKRRYHDPADFDEEWVYDDDEEIPLRTFGKYRGNQVIVPDDIDGLPSTRENDTLASNPDILLYQAEIDNGFAWRCLRPTWALVCFYPWTVFQFVAAGSCSCDEICCWIRKEYSTRKYYRIYPNRIEINDPGVRIPFGCLGCGSWNADNVIAHPFDRGAFGFHRVQFGVCHNCIWAFPIHGDTVARQRCQCNGPVWKGGWWCDEWICNMLCCTYRYSGLADGDEVAFASNLALQAYFEGRKLTANDMEKCLDYWRQHVSEYREPQDRKRDVMCHPCCIPCFPTTFIYRITQCKRNIPFQRGNNNKQAVTKQLKKAHDKYEQLRQKQIERYSNFKYPARLSTVCRVLGCRRVFGRKGLIFCTEGCNDNKAIGHCYKGLDMQPDDPFPPAPHQDLDDHYHAARVLQTVLGNPPPNVVYRRWDWDPTTRKYIVVENDGRTEYKNATRTATAAYTKSKGNTTISKRRLGTSPDLPLSPGNGGSNRSINKDNTEVPSTVEGSLESRDDPITTTSAIETVYFDTTSRTKTNDQKSNRNGATLLLDHAGVTTAPLYKGNF